MEKANGKLTDFLQRLILRRVLEDVVKACCRHLLDARNDVAVCIQRHLNAGVSQSFLHHFWMYPLFKHEGGMAMPGVMEPNDL